MLMDISQFIRVNKDGTVERHNGSPYVPPSPEDPTTGVSSKDFTISPHVSARLYLPKLPPTSTTHPKLPILVYYHGGGFCLGSAFSLLEHSYLNSIVSQVKSLAVSVEYRLAPEHPVSTVYEDCWEALQWVASHSIQQIIKKEPWLVDYGDFERIYIGGDSAGGNIVHHMAMRAGKERLNGDVKILGGFLSHAYFLGSKPIGSESSENHEETLYAKFWRFAYPSAPGGFDNPMINPLVRDGRDLAGLGCSRLLVVVSEKDELRERGKRYCEAVRESGWEGEMELIDVEGEDHCFHVIHPDTDKAKNLIKRLASFINPCDED